MGVRDRLDPEFVAAVAARPVFDIHDIEQARRIRIDLAPVAAADPAVARADHTAPGRDGNPDVAVRLFRPVAASEPVGCVLWIQGGGYVLTAADFDDAWCQGVVRAHGCVVVSVDWRRAPEHPFPAAADDCYTALAWIFEKAAELGVDPARVVAAGNSSGGGSAAGLALRARDAGEFAIAHSLLVYPMLDDTDTTRSSHLVTDPELWNREKNEYGWRSYLGDTYGTDRVSPYAAPARMADLAGLPPTSILTGELDLFVDENVTYASRLMAAGVRTELHVYPRAHHGFDRDAPDSSVGRQFYADRDAILRRALA